MDITVDCSECHFEIFEREEKTCDIRISPKNGSGGLFLRHIAVEKLEQLLKKLAHQQRERRIRAKDDGVRRCGDCGVPIYECECN